MKKETEMESPDKSSLKAFIEDTSRRFGVSVPAAWEKLSEVELARTYLQRLNEYFFQTHDGIGNAEFEGEEFQYFSEFHRFWEKNYAEILNARVDRAQAKVAARALAAALTKYGPTLLSVSHTTHGLRAAAIAQVRFFTANQDFRQPPENQYAKRLDDPAHFEAQAVYGDPDGFLHFMGLTSQSQTDKRRDFARNAAGFLLKNGITAYEIAKHFGHDAVRIRSAIVEEPNMGYGSKKANMFIRDMVEMNVWSGLSRLDEIDVASDINTMKLALRTRILKTDIPLLSSFLDIFCHQYGNVDTMSAKAWRVVWEEWRQLSPPTAPDSPCRMDFLLYRIGREYCDDNVVRYVCPEGHSFYNFGARAKLCRVCGSHRKRTVASSDGRFLPCQLESKDLPREDGVLLLRDTNLLTLFDGRCILEDVCKPKTDEFRILNPPQSISIKGRTGWTNSYSDAGRGGGGMMG